MAAGARALLLWSRQQTEGYNEVNIYNMTSSWRDGLAFCAIIHRYRPDLIDFEKLSKENIIMNIEKAFDICERHLDIPSILDIHDMVGKPVPDKLGVITFVSQLFNYFKDKIPANQVVSTKMSSSIKAKGDVSQAGKSGKRASNRNYALQGKAKKISSALKNVFRSDNKDDRLKPDDTLAKSQSTENLKGIPENDQNTETVHPSNSCTARVPYLGPNCSICQDKVYIIERVVAEHRLFHRACFKCSKCDSGLTPGAYSYSPETESFCCIYECMEDFRKRNTEHIKIKLQPITDKVLDVIEESKRSRGNSSTETPVDSRCLSNTFTPSFSIVKKNVITIDSLPRSFEDIPKRKKSSSRRHSTEQNAKKDCLLVNSKVESNKSKSDSSLHNSAETQLEVIVKRENGKVKSSVKINPIKPKLTPYISVQKDDENGQGTENINEQGDIKCKQIWKEKIKDSVGLNDAYIREEEEKPQEGSVQKLCQKFMNIEDMIEYKHKQNVAKKNERMQREIRRVVRNWNEQPNENENYSQKEKEKVDESEDSNDSLATSSGQSSSSQIDDINESDNNRSRVLHSPINDASQNTNLQYKSGESKLRSHNSSIPVKNVSKLSLPVDNSSSSPSSTPSPTMQTIPIIVRPSIDSESEREDDRERKCSQTSIISSNCFISPPFSDTSSTPESPLSPMSPCDKKWPSQNSFTETPSPSDFPKMSIVIAQESSYTKVNSRFFTVETCECKGMDDNIIAEENGIETIDIEGEFCFGVEGNKFSKVQNDYLKSLRKYRIRRVKSGLVHEEEVILSPLEMSVELHALETLHTELEKRGVEMEKVLRTTMMGSNRPLDNEDEMLKDWLTLVQEKNIISKREYELIYVIKYHQYEDRYLSVECELRSLLSMRDEEKSLEDVKRERALMSELFNLVQRRSYIVDKLEQDRLREKQEDDGVMKQIIDNGVNDVQEDSWENKQDYTTKVAFSRFYC